MTGRKAGIPSKHAARLQLILTALQAATTPQDMDLPGLRLHPLGGNRRGTWSVDVSGNWRVTFKFRESHVIEVNYEDTH